MTRVCGIGWKLPSLTQGSHTSAVHGFAHTSPRHARRPASRTRSLQLGHTRPWMSHTHLQQASSERKPNAQLCPLGTRFADTHLGLRPQPRPVAQSRFDPTPEFSAPPPPPVHTCGAALTGLCVFVRLSGRAASGPRGSSVGGLLEFCWPLLPPKGPLRPFCPGLQCAAGYTKARKGADRWYDCARSPGLLPPRSGLEMTVSLTPPAPPGLMLQELGLMLGTALDRDPNFLVPLFLSS